jgi:hypothetical protein
MALNDWKKYATNEWSKKDDKYSFVKVWKIGLSSKERKRRGIELWGFSARIGEDEEKLYFKSKQQAEKNAYEYMKKH